MKGVKCGIDCLNCPLPQCKHDVAEEKAKKKEPEKPKGLPQARVQQGILCGTCRGAERESTETVQEAGVWIGSATSRT